MQAILYALKQAYINLKKVNSLFFSRFTICFASTGKKMSILCLYKCKLHKIDLNQKEIVFMWVPKEALDKEPTDNFIPFQT